MDSMIAIGAQAPDFQLDDLQGRNHALKEMGGSIVVLNFWSPECTWCERVDRELAVYLDQWKNMVHVWWIASNSCDAFSDISKVATDRKLPCVLLDSEQYVANLYGAQTTPHIFVVDQAGKLVYRGAWDDITFRQRVATQVYLPRVLEALIDGRSPDIFETPPYGCVLVRPYAEEH